MEVPKSDITSTAQGIILPDPETIREIRQKRAKDGIDIMTVDNRPLDNYLWGKLIHDSSHLGLKEGNHILFNKFDAEEFSVGGKRYFRVNNLNALAYYV